MASDPHLEPVQLWLEHIFAKHPKRYLKRLCQSLNDNLWPSSRVTAMNLDPWGLLVIDGYARREWARSQRRLADLKISCVDPIRQYDTEAEALADLAYNRLLIARNERTDIDIAMALALFPALRIESVSHWIWPARRDALLKVARSHTRNGRQLPSTSAHLWQLRLDLYAKLGPGPECLAWIDLRKPAQKRRFIEEYLTENPDASELVAKAETRVSAPTIRKVRKKLRKISSTSSRPSPA